MKQRCPPIATLCLREALLALLTAALLCLNFGTSASLASGGQEIVSALSDCGDIGDHRHPPCHACEPDVLSLHAPPMSSFSFHRPALKTGYGNVLETAGSGEVSTAYRSRAPPIAA